MTESFNIQNMLSISLFFLNEKNLVDLIQNAKKKKKTAAFEKTSKAEKASTQTKIRKIKSSKSKNIFKFLSKELRFRIMSIAKIIFFLVSPSSPFKLSSKVMFSVFIVNVVIDFIFPHKFKGGRKKFKIDNVIYLIIKKNNNNYHMILRKQLKELIAIENVLFFEKYLTSAIKKKFHANLLKQFLAAKKKTH